MSTEKNKFFKMSSTDDRRKKTMENRSPWSSAGSTGSTSPLPVPANRFKLDKSGSGGSTCSLGSSPGTATPGGGGSFSSLTVPEPLPAGKVTRSTSPFNFKARVRRRKEKKLEKQANVNLVSDDLSSMLVYGKQNSLSPCPSFESVVPTSPPILMTTTTTTTTTENGTKEKSSRLKDLRKKSRENSPFSLNFRRNLKSPGGHSDPHCPAAVQASSLLMSSRSRSGECESLSPGRGVSPENRSPRSPASPGGPCKCRRCSLLPLEECEPKEMNALFKFLRKSKVNKTEEKKK